MKTYDAGDQREQLAQDYADWIAAGFISTEKAQRFYRRVRILARAISRPWQEVLNVIKHDAETITSD